MVVQIVFHTSVPVCQEVLDISQIAPAYYRESAHHLFIQCWLQQYCWSSFFHSSYGSFSNAICFGSMRWWCSMIPWLIFTRFSKLQWIVSVNNFGFFAAARGTFVNSFPSPVKSLFCTDRTESIWVARSWPTTAYRWLSLDSHSSLRTLWSAVIKSPNFSAQSWASPVRLLQGALVILVLKQTSQFRSFGKWV